MIRTPPKPSMARVCVAPPATGRVVVVAEAVLTGVGVGVVVVVAPIVRLRVKEVLSPVMTMVWLPAVRVVGV